MRRKMPNNPVRLTMKISEVCPHCGAERLSWLGSSHYKRDWSGDRYDVPWCEDGRSPEQAWQDSRLPYMSSPSL